MSWLIEDSRHDGALESVFALGNGYLGVRGAPEEGTPAYDGGMVLNGFYETWPIAYPEDAYGLARTGQTIVAPPDGSIVRLFADGEPLDVDRRARAPRARHARRRPAPRGRVRDGEWRAAARALAPAGLARAPQPRRHRLRGHRARRRGRGRPLLGAAPPRGGGGRRRPAPPQGLRRAAARPGRGRDARAASGADAGDPALRSHARRAACTTTSTARGRSTTTVDGDAGARRRRRLRRGGRLAEAAQVRRLPLDRGRGARPHGRSRPPHARPRGA